MTENRNNLNGCNSLAIVTMRGQINCQREQQVRRIKKVRLTQTTITLIKLTFTFMVELLQCGYNHANGLLVKLLFNVSNYYLCKNMLNILVIQFLLLF